MHIDMDFLAYPLPPDVQRLYEAGDFERMARVIRQRMDDPRTPETLKKRLAYQLEIAGDIPAAYPYDQAALLAELQKTIRDFTEDELETLRDDGSLDWRYIGGKVYFKDNCVSCLLKTRPAYAARAINPEPKSTALSDVIAKMKANGGAHVRFTMHEEMTIKSDRLTPGETLRIHLPLPVVYAQVKSAQLLSTSHAPKLINPETHPARTAYFELPYEPGMTVSADVQWEIDTKYVQPDPDAVTAQHPDFDLEEMPPHVVFTPYLRALAKEIVGSETNPLKKARRIYDFITTQAVYRYMPAYRTVPNIPEYFCSGLRGDCGVQAITFVTLCRLCGIPAQWQAGRYTTPGTTGNHDWARFYVEPYGWLFADCSFGGSAYRAGEPERWNFYFGNLEPWRLPQCRRFQEQFTPPMAFLRHDPTDNQNGEAETLNRALGRDEYDTDSKILSYEEL